MYRENTTAFCAMQASRTSGDSLSPLRTRGQFAVTHLGDLLHVKDLIRLAAGTLYDQMDEMQFGDDGRRQGG
jgi:hypothetical protein